MVADLTGKVVDEVRRVHHPCHFAVVSLRRRRRGHRQIRAELALQHSWVVRVVLIDLIQRTVVSRRNRRHNLLLFLTGTCHLYIAKNIQTSEMTGL